MTSPPTSNRPIVEVDPCSDARWERLAVRRGSLFTSPEWLRAIAHTYAFQPAAHLLVDTPAGDPTAGMAFCELDDLQGHRIISTPFCDFCDPIVDTKSEWDALAAPLLSQPRPLRVRVLDRSVASTDNRFTRRGEDHWHGVELDQPEDELWAGIGSGARRNVQKARAAGLSVRFDTSPEAIDVFFGMHQRTRRGKYGLLAQPRAFLHRVHREFSPTDSVAVALAEHDGRPVAGIFLLEFAGRAYYKLNASDPAQLELRPNDLLMWEAIRRSNERGNDLLDLGLSGSDQPGLIRFKEKFARRTQLVCTLTAGPDPEPPSNEFGPLLAGLTELLTDERVPLDLSERAGNLLYRYFA